MTGTERNQSQDDTPSPLDYGQPPPPGVPLYRRLFARVLAYAAVVLVVLGAMSGNGSAFVNLLTFAFALGIAAVLIRYGNVRL